MREPIPELESKFSVSDPFKAKNQVFPLRPLELESGVVQCNGPAESLSAEPFFVAMICIRTDARDNCRRFLQAGVADL